MFLSDLTIFNITMSIINVLLIITIAPLHSSNESNLEPLMLSSVRGSGKQRITPENKIIIDKPYNIAAQMPNILVNLSFFLELILFG